MKKHLFYPFLLFLPLLSFGQWSVNFEDGVFPPTGWSVEKTNANENWELDTSGQANGTNVAWVNYDPQVGLQDERLISAPSDLTKMEVPILKFVSFASYAWSVSPHNNSDMTVEISTDNGATWTPIWSEDDLGNFGEFKPIAVELDLSAYASEKNAIFSWRYLGTDGAAWYIDDLKLEDKNGNSSPENGCLDAPGGQYPSTVFVPDGIGIPEAMTNGMGYTGEYSKVQVKEGIEYTFTVSDPSYFITIGDENGETVLAYGEGTATWTSDRNGIIRFYSHLDSSCGYNNSTYHDRLVQYGEIPPYDPCSPVHLGVTANSIGISNNYTVANDINVTAGNKFTVQSITFNIQTEGGEPTTFNVGFYDGETIAENPFGQKYEHITPTSVVKKGMYLGIFPIYAVTITLPTPLVLPATETADKRYWVAISGDLDTIGSWEYWDAFKYSDTNTLKLIQSHDGGQTWYVYANDKGDEYEGVMSVQGECEDLLVVSDTAKSKVSFYPNPVNDVLNISADQKITSVSIYNVAGQKVINNVKANDGKINVSRLVAGTYIVTAILENGKTETFKVIKK